MGNGANKKSLESYIYGAVILCLSICFLVLSQIVHIGYEIAPVYFVFLLISLSLYLFRETSGRALYVVVLLLFFFLFVCSESGPDYLSYKQIYEAVRTRNDFSGIHGEILYLIINKIFSYFLSYDVFRVLFLGSFLALFAYSVGKLSPEPILTFLMTVMGLIVYLISAYRQFAVCAITFYSFHLVLNKQKKGLPLLLCFLGIFLHAASLVSLVIVGLLIIKKDFTVKDHYLWIIVALLVRTILSILLRNTIIASIVSIFSVYTDITLISFGFLSRLAELSFLSFYVRRVRLSESGQKIFFTYFVLSIIYIAVPYEFLMARLFIICRFMVALLIPIIARSEQTLKCGMFFRKKYAVKYESRVIFISLYFVLFLYQMMFQNGYFPYVNMIF